MTVGENVGVVPRLLGWSARAHAPALARAAGDARARSRAVLRSLSGRALGWPGAARRRRARARRRSSRAAHGRTFRRARSGQPRGDPGRVPAHATVAAQDRAVREPRHRRGGENRRPHRDLRVGAPRAIRRARHASGAARQRLRGELRRQRSHAQAPAPDTRRRGDGRGRWDRSTLAEPTVRASDDLRRVAALFLETTADSLPCVDGDGQCRRAQSRAPRSRRASAGRLRHELPTKPRSRLRWRTRLAATIDHALRGPRHASRWRSRSRSSPADCGPTCCAIARTSCT